MHSYQKKTADYSILNAPTMNPLKWTDMGYMINIELAKLKTCCNV